MNEKVQEVFTIGHGNDEPERFLQRLRRHGVTLVCDVRRFPDTARLAHFRRKGLSAVLQAAGIGYREFGAALGGFREGGYESFARSGEFRAAVTELEKLARNHRIALLCAELDPRRCHRRFIARELVRRGRPVRHILTGGEAIPHAHLSRGLTGDLFADEA